MPAAGATRLRASGAPPPRWRNAAWGGAGLAAATVVAVLVVAPMLKEDRGAVSASEILAESVSRLAQATSGIEIREYELVIDGVPKALMPDHENGTYRVRQVIDHTQTGRFVFASFSPGGQPVSSIAQDPATGRRSMMVILEGQAYRFDVDINGAGGPSLPEIERLHMEASIAMMQASGQPALEVLETPAGRQYRIEVPRVSDPGQSPVWDLSEARVLIDASDYRVTELAVKGTFLKQAYSVVYRLISRQVVADVAAGTFAIAPQPGEIRIAGSDGSVLPARDAMVLALRELKRLKLTHER